MQAKNETAVQSVVPSGHFICGACASASRGCRNTRLNFAISVRRQSTGESLEVWLSRAL